MTTTLTAGAIGACLGSFAATAALRMTDREQPLRGRSHCDACRIGLSYAATLPIVSFLRLRGACAACGARIDRTHLVGEVAGPVIMLTSLVIAPFERAVLISALGLALMTSAIIDLRSQRLPDGLTLAVAVIGAALAAQRSIESLLIGFLAAALTFALLELVRRGYRRLRGESGLGFGDVKLAAALALWLGLATPWALSLAALGALVWVMLVRPADRGLAFGPYIAAAAWGLGLFSEATGWLT